MPRRLDFDDPPGSMIDGGDGFAVAEASDEPLHDRALH